MAGCEASAMAGATCCGSAAGRTATGAALSTWAEGAGVAAGAVPCCGEGIAKSGAAAGVG